MSADTELLTSGSASLRLVPRSTAKGGLRRGRIRAVLIVDVLSIWVAMATTYVAAELIAPPSAVVPANAVAGLVACATVLWVAMFAAYGLYERETRAIAANSLDDVASLFHALLAGSLVILVVNQVLKHSIGWMVYTPLEAAVFLGLALLLVPLARTCVRRWVLARVLQKRRTLIVGAGADGRKVEHKLKLHPEYGVEVLGFIDETRADHDVLGTPADLAWMVDALDVDWVVVATNGEPTSEMLDQMREVRRPDVHLSIVPTYSELFSANATIEELHGIPVVSLPAVRLSRSVLAVKRAIDVAFSSAALLAFSPLLVAIAVAVKFDSPGPILFRQRRHGRGGTEFKILKFRTMSADAESQRLAMAHLNEMEGDGPLFKMANDPRITKVGAFLRKTSLDELPQFWNVLRGEMSLVGPRPFVVHESEQITGWAGRRLDTTPGITGLWQVMGRNDIPFAEMVKLDYVYVTNWSLWWDIKILLRTVPSVLGRRGAY